MGRYSIFSDADLAYIAQNPHNLSTVQLAARFNCETGTISAKRRTLRKEGRTVRVFDAKAAPPPAPVKSSRFYQPFRDGTYT